MSLILRIKQVKDWIHGVRWGHCRCWSAGTGDTERWCGPDREGWWLQIPWWVAKIIRWWFPAQSEFLNGTSAQSPRGLAGIQLDVAGMEVSYSESWLQTNAIPNYSWDRLALQCRNVDDHTVWGSAGKASSLVRGYWVELEGCSEDKLTSWRTSSSCCAIRVVRWLTNFNGWWTRCSAIAERPRCRVRYSFRQK